MNTALWKTSQIPKTSTEKEDGEYELDEFIIRGRTGLEMLHGFSGDDRYSIKLNEPKEFIQKSWFFSDYRVIVSLDHKLEVD